MAKLLAVDDFDSAVGGMGHEYATTGLMYVTVVKATGRGVGRQLNFAHQLHCHYGRATSFWHQAYRASYMGVSSSILRWSSSPWINAKPCATA